MTLSILRLAVIVLALLVTGAAYSNPPSPTPSIDGQHQKRHPSTPEEKAAHDPAGTDKQPFVVKSLEAEKTPERTEQERPEREEKAANERSLIVWTIVLAGTTIILALFAGGQLYMFWVQLGLIRISLDEAKTAAEAASKAADAAERTVNTMKDTAERQLRAYTMVLRAEILNISPSPNLTESWIDITFKNFGQTPATKVTSQFAFSVKECPLRTALEGEPMTRPIGVIAPGDKWTARLKMPLTDSLTLVDRHTAFYIHGEIRYCDGFNPDRVTSFRYMRKGGKNWFDDGEMETCPEGNEAN